LIKGSLREAPKICSPVKRGDFTPGLSPIYIVELGPIKTFKRAFKRQF